MTRGRVTVACNLAAGAQAVPVGSSNPKLIAMASDVTITPGISLESSTIDLPPDSVAILIDS
jgi:hypothetical protein